MKPPNSNDDMATDFDGATYVPALDGQRLGRQQQNVLNIMRDGKWRTLREIADAAGASEASVSARLRDFRKERHGHQTVERQRVMGGMHVYRLILHPGDAADD